MRIHGASHRDVQRERWIFDVSCMEMRDAGVPLSGVPVDESEIDHVRVAKK